MTADRSVSTGNNGGHRPPLQLGAKKIELTRIGRCRLFGGREGKIKSEPVSEAPACLRRETFEMVVHETPDAASLRQMPLNLQRPTLQRGLAFPKKFPVAMDPLAARIVLRRVITQEPEIKKVGRAREEFEGRKIAFVQWARVGPDPADAVFFQETDDLRPVPAGMTKLYGKAKIARELFQKFAQGCPALFRRKERR